MPAVHSVQALAPLPLCAAPVAQGMQAARPLTLANVPGSHDWQVDCDCDAE